MNEYTATETAFKNGYEKGKADALKDSDMVKVVRCKDCRYYAESDFNGEILHGCEANGGLLDCTPNSFCSYGERKEI